MKEMISYEDLSDELALAPQTWIPALIAVLVRQSVQKKVFAPGGLRSLVERVEVTEQANQAEPHL